MATISGLVIDEGCRYGWQYSTAIACQRLSTAQTLGMLVTGVIDAGEVVHASA